jgi:hypothetical protein
VQSITLGVFYWSIESRVNAACFLRESHHPFGIVLERLRAFERGLFQALAQSIQAGSMADFLNLVMLVCAAVGSMAFGILAAYGLLRAGFALMRPRPRTAPVHAQQAVVSEP